MFEFELVPARQLATDDLQQWAAMQQHNATLDSPYFRPEFTQAVAAVRDDVWVAVIRRHAAAVGYFPFQRGKLGLGKLSDYHGIISQGDLALSAEQLLRACGLASWDFDHLVAGQSAFGPYVRQAAVSPYLDLAHGFEAYAVCKKATGSEELFKIGRKARKLERERGELEFRWHDDSPEAFDTLLGWKSAQYRATGFADVFEFPWTSALLREIASSKASDFGATISTLYVSGRLAAACYSLRSRGVLHAWFNAYSPEFAAYSPGLVLFERMARAAEQHGATKIDLGKGEERYKRCLASAATEVLEGGVELQSLSVWLRSSWRRTRDWMEASSLSGVSKVPGKIVQPIRKWIAFH
jgi:CelD/BcsL family acetyltransferase involved in cellulose biosynthesis